MKNKRKSTKRRIYTPSPIRGSGQKHHDRLRARALARARDERQAGIDPNDAAGRWLAQNDR
jgi:hypothetical protein